MALSSLPLFHRVSGERVVVVGRGEAADAKRRLIERAGGRCCGETEAHHARLAFVAVDNEADARTIALRLSRKGLLINVADRPELCDFTLPSVLERDPVVIAVGTAGTSAALAKHLRLRLEAMLPNSLGALARALHSARDAMRQRWPAADERRQAIDRALQEGGPLDPFGEGGAERVTAWIAGPHEGRKHATVEITLRSDDPDDLTLREARLLGAADAVVTEAGVSAAILARVRADAARTPVEGGLTVVLRRKSDPSLSTDPDERK